MLDCSTLSPPQAESRCRTDDVLRVDPHRLPRLGLPRLDGPAAVAAEHGRQETTRIWHSIFALPLKHADYITNRGIPQISSAPVTRGRRVGLPVCSASQAHRRKMTRPGGNMGSGWPMRVLHNGLNRVTGRAAEHGCYLPPASFICPTAAPPPPTCSRGSAAAWPAAREGSRRTCSRQEGRGNSRVTVTGSKPKQKQ